MKRIHISEYNERLGILIDVRHPLDYKSEEHHHVSKNIHYQKLIAGHNTYLNKNDKYFITCYKGIVSKKTVINLEYLGYDVTQVYY